MSAAEHTSTDNPNPGIDRTWCICGATTYPGDVAQHRVACCGGQLDRYRQEVTDAG